MSDSDSRDERDEIMDQMKDLAVRGVVLSITDTIERIELEMGGNRHLDPVSFLAGTVYAGVAEGSIPEEFAANVVAAVVNEIAPQLDGLPDPATAFDDLPVREKDE
jgi:hypothetical protein